jgi:hypothetical protein
MIGVDRVHAGNTLGIILVDGFAIIVTEVVFVGDFDRAFLLRRCRKRCTFRVHVPGFLTHASR